VIAGDEPSPWKLLAGGTIVGIERDGDVLGVTVELLSVRVKLMLAGCDGIRYQPHDEPLLYELDEIAASEPDIRDASVDHGAMVVTGGAGDLRITYANLAIELDGARVTLDDLEQRLRR
jgi:hypothetical protein